MGWAEDLDTEASVSRVHAVDSRMIAASTEDEEATKEEDTEAGLADQSSIRDRISTSEMVTSSTRTEIGRTGQFRASLGNLSLKKPGLETSFSA